MNPVLVTGASGFVGSHVVRALVRQGHDIVSVFHKSGLEEDKRHFRLDLRDFAALEKLFRQFRFSSVIHLAAAGVLAESETLDALSAINVEATAALGRLALANNVDRFLHVGTGFEYRPQAHPIDESAPLSAPNLYGASKAAGWMLLDALHRLEGLPLVTLRPFSIYGPGEACPICDSASTRRRADSSHPRQPGARLHFHRRHCGSIAARAYCSVRYWPRI